MTTDWRRAVQGAGEQSVRWPRALQSRDGQIDYRRVPGWPGCPRLSYGAILEARSSGVVH
jgi:hypothetical protein